MRIPLKNWFDHTNLGELEIKWEAGGQSGTLTADLAPHAAGELVIPGRAWRDEDQVRLRFTANQPGYSYLVDEFLLPLVEPVVVFPGPQGPAPALAETADRITVTGADFEVVFDKAAGSILSGTCKGELLLSGGPFLNLAPLKVAPFTPAFVTARTEPPVVVVGISGAHGSIGVEYTLRIDGAGFIETTWTINDPPANAASYSEVGVAFELADAIDGLEWEPQGALLGVSG